MKYRDAAEKKDPIAFGTGELVGNVATGAAAGAAGAGLAAKGVSKLLSIPKVAQVAANSTPAQVAGKLIPQVTGGASGGFVSGLGGSLDVENATDDAILGAAVPLMVPAIAGKVGKLYGGGLKGYLNNAIAGTAVGAGTGALIADDPMDGAEQGALVGLGLSHAKPVVSGLANVTGGVSRYAGDLLGNIAGRPNGSVKIPGLAGFVDKSIGKLNQTLDNVGDVKGTHALDIDMKDFNKSSDLLKPIQTHANPSILKGLGLADDQVDDVWHNAKLIDEQYDIIRMRDKETPVHMDFDAFEALTEKETDKFLEKFGNYQKRVADNARRKEAADYTTMKLNEYLDDVGNVDQRIRDEVKHQIGRGALVGGGVGGLSPADEDDVRKDFASGRSNTYGGE